jgi:hypothetical protein
MLKETEEIKTMINDIYDAVGIMGGIELTEWESEFLEDIAEQLDERNLTVNEINKIEEIYNKIHR